MGRERNSNVWLRIAALATILAGCHGQGYYGVKIGNLEPLAHAVKGEVFAVDSRTIHIRGFSYDGTAPDAFFYAGTSGQPSDRGYIIPDEKGTKNILGAYRNKHITLTLPDGQTLKDISWISVWCRAFAINFGHVMIPARFDYPRPQKIDAFPTFEHGVSSDRIVVVDAQTFLIPNFSYDGQAPDAHFWVGKGSGPGPTGNMVPDENGAEEPLKKYTSKTIVITLPGAQTVFDIDHLSVWCRAFFADFGHVRIPKNLNIPPSLKMLGVAPQSPGYSYSAPSDRPSFSHKPKSASSSASYKPATPSPKPTTHRPPPTTTPRYKAKTPRPTYKPRTTRKPYRPPTTTRKPYRPRTTTPKPYKPRTTTPRPYRPPTTTRRPYRPPTTTRKPYKPRTTTPRYTTPKPTYRPTTPRTYYKPTSPRGIVNPFAYRPPQTSSRPTTTPRPYYKPSTTSRPYHPSVSSTYRPVYSPSTHHTPYRHPSATNRDPFGHFGRSKALHFPRESEERSSSSLKSSKRHKTSSTRQTKEVAPAHSSSEEEPRKSESSSSSSKSRSRSHTSSLGHFSAASHFTAASHFGVPNHRFSHSKGRSNEDLSGSSERARTFPYEQRSSESFETDRRYTRSHIGEKNSNEEKSKSFSSVSINMGGHSMSHYTNHR